MQGGAFRRKLVIVGDGACGKTSLLSVFAMGEFPQEYTPTIFEVRTVSSGLPSMRHDRLRPLSYSKSHVILIAFALDTPDSLENVTVKWIDEVRELCGPSIPVLLVGCKKDLRDQAMQSGGGERGGFVTTEQGQQIAAQIGARSYHECSALLNHGVDETFEQATRAAMLVRGQGAGGHNLAEDDHHGGAGGKERARRDARRRAERDDEGGGCCGCVIL
ncbi:hypothetical protein Rhopal_007627-T1 [Rhodotorula paludigena]|uniref:Uncharacterized protein n=1 Tax=Rhodotorula paludigena TaxID=86838 RepID=A0AAV5GX59_9BASI|nr:hypothetical protein Rhopal_007627-T1 [Rhodotorula paludigena]